MRHRRPGPIDDSERVIKDRLRSHERTMHRAVRLLSAKPRSVGELRKRLLEKIWTNADIVDAVIEKLKEYKYLDDKQYAADLAASKLRQRPQGKRKLKQFLSRKDLRAEDLDHGVRTALEKTPEHEMIDRAIEKRIRLKGIPQTRDEMKKFYDHLLRLGFDYGLIRTKMSEASAHRSETEE